jgi:hypothetical protein
MNTRHHKIESRWMVVCVLMWVMIYDPIMARAASVRADNTATGTSSSFSVTAPAGTVAGDVVVVLAVANGITTISDNNGSTPFTKDVSDIRPGSGSVTISLFSRRIQAGDPTTYQFTPTTGSEWRLYAVTIQNPHPSTFYDAGPSYACAASTTVSTAAITTTTANALLLQLFGVDVSPAITFSNKPASYTEIEEQLSTRAINIFARTQTTAGLEAAQTVTISGVAQYHCGIALGIAPAPTNSPPVNVVPGNQTVQQNTPLLIAGVSVTDGDGNMSTCRASVVSGTVTVNLSGGATITAGANGSATLTLSGTQTQINAALATLTYQGTLNFVGGDTLTILSTDSVSATDTDTVAITVTAAAVDIEGGLIWFE